MEVEERDDNEVLKALCEDLERDFEGLGEALANMVNNIAETLAKALERVIEMLNTYTVEKIKPRPKYKPVKSLVKPYNPPFIKVRYRARANLRG